MLASPAPLTEAHELKRFRCGAETLDQWLKRRARANQVSGASRTYVVAEGIRVVAFYCLSSGALDLADAPGALRRNMPDPLPMAIMGRLAVDLDWQRKGLGVALLHNAVLRVGQAAAIMGIRSILVHAISAEAKVFYQRYGFAASLRHPMTLVLSLRVPSRAKVRRSCSSSSPARSPVPSARRRHVC